MPSLVEGIFPSSRTGKPKRVMIGREIFDAERYEGSLEDERRLFYVASTRAKDVLVLSSHKEAAESSFVSELSGEWQDLSEHDSLPECHVSSGGDPDDIQAFSTSEIGSYRTCPYSYRLNRIWGYQPGFSEYLGYGKTLHFCLRCASEMTISQGCSPVDAIKASLDDQFFLPFIARQRSEEILQAARDKLVRFVDERSEDMKHIKEVESRVEFPLQKATVIGRIDVLIRDGNSIEIRDYKTSKENAYDDPDLQVQMYALGRRMIGEKVSKGSVAYLDDASFREVDVNDRQLATAREAVEKHIAGIMARDFRPHPGQHCQSCNYGAICRWNGGR
jgi:DNA helicase-2/ATP-dependent DNA helicase PcrA